MTRMSVRLIAGRALGTGTIGEFLLEFHMAHRCSLLWGRERLFGDLLLIAALRRNRVKSSFIVIRLLKVHVQLVFVVRLVDDSVRFALGVCRSRVMRLGFQCALVGEIVFIVTKGIRVIRRS